MSGGRVRLGDVSDSRIRTLERAWRKSGAEADEIAYLRARIEAGGLEAERVELAAALGHSPAVEAQSEPPPVIDTTDLRDWVLSLERFGVEASALVIGVSGRLTLPEDAPRGTPRLEGVLAAEALVKCPCDFHERAARIKWTEDAAWVNHVPWAELSAEIAWEAHWATSEQTVRSKISAKLLQWALEPSRGWDGVGTGGDLPPEQGLKDGSH